MAKFHEFLLKRVFIPGLSRAFRRAHLDPDQVKAHLAEIVKTNWPSSKGDDTSFTPEIIDSPRLKQGACVVPTFEENGTRYVVLAQAGEHYQTERPCFMALGGYANLERREGSSLVKPQTGIPESPQHTAAREAEEEMVDDNGAPILKVNPRSLRPVYTKNLQSPKDCNVVGFFQELTANEIATVKRHVQRLNEDPNYKRAASQATKCIYSGLSEIASIKILPLADVLDETKVNLMLPGQRQLFRNIKKFFDCFEPRARILQP